MILKQRLIVVILILAIVAVSLFNIFSKDKKEEVAIGDKEFSYVEIKTDNADIEIMPAGNKSPKVELLKNKNKYKLDVNVDGDILEIEVEKKFFRWLNFNFFSSTPTLKVYLPERKYETIAVETDNGDIEGSALEAKEIKVVTDNGDILFEDVKSAIYLKSDNGDFILENIDGEIIGLTDNGDLTLTTEHMDRPIEFETDNGDIHINTKKAPTNVTFDIETDNGDVLIFSETNYDSVVGNGENLIKITTDNGDVTIEK